MAEEKEKYGNRAGDLEVPTPWGPLKARGPMLSVIVVMVLVGAILFYQAYTNHQLDDQMRKSNMEAIQRGQQAVVDSQQKMTDAIEIMTYLSTRTEAEKQAMRLDMPDALRRRIEYEAPRRPR